MKKYIPNTITLCNLLSGGAGFVFRHRSNIEMALAMMLLAAVFDFFDGMVARALGVSSELGKELDSLSDCVSFGVLPSLMLLHFGISNCVYNPIFCYTALLIAAFSALRLGMFNIDKRQSSSFIGLATPASGILIASFCVFLGTKAGWGSLVFIATHAWTIPAISILICFLLVAEIPMFSMKFSKTTDKRTMVQRWVLLTCVVATISVCIVMKFHYSFLILVTFICYILINLLSLCFIKK